MNDKYVYVDDLVATHTRTHKSIKALSESDQKLYTPTKKKLKRLVELLLSDVSMLCSRIGLEFSYSLKEPQEKEKPTPNNYTKAQHEMFIIGQQFKKFQSIHYIDPDLELFRDLLIKWFNARFKPGFIFNRSNIPIWIDRFIIAFGYYCSTDNVGEFSLILDNWISTLSDPNNPVPFPLPKEISRVGEDLKCIRSEAAIIEMRVKESLYTHEDFFMYKHTITDRWRRLSDYTESQMNDTSKIKLV